MDLSFANIEHLALLGFWILLWVIGGIWVSKAVFRVQRHEKMLVGIITGFVLEVFLTNLFCRVIDPAVAFWLAPALLFAAGLVLCVRRDWREIYQLDLNYSHLVVLLILIYVFMAVGRGLAIFDDYAHLPITSIMAAGSVPPQFPLDPALPYSYHYFLILFASQVMKIGNLFVWTALDIARGAAFGLGIMAVALWAQRLTRSSLAAFFAGMMAAFGSGLRWLFLLLPDAVMRPVSESITMLGSAVTTAPDLQSAITSPWIIEGSGPFPFPFAYINGLSAPAVMAHGSTGYILAAVIFLLLLTFNRWQNWSGGLLSVCFLSSIALIDETMFGLIIIAWGAIVVLQIIRQKKLSIPGALRSWLIVMAAAVLVALIQGGAWTGLAAGWLDKLFGSSAADSSFQVFAFQFGLIPKIVSSHLGVLSFNNVWHILAAVLEVGLIVLVLPLIVIYALKSWRAERWAELAILLSGIGSLAFLFVQFTGSGGVRNTSRVYEFITLCYWWSVPLIWLWLKKRSEQMRVTAGVLGLIVIFSGITLFGIELVAAQKPVNSTWLTQLDRDFHYRYWDQLEEDALVFDPLSYRAPTVFGRYTDSNIFFYTTKPEWTALYDRPDPYELQAAGFDYLYYDYVYDYEVKGRYDDILSAECVVVVDEIQHKHTEDFRRLLDLRGCK